MTSKRRDNNKKPPSIVHEAGDLRLVFSPTADGKTHVSIDGPKEQMDRLLEAFKQGFVVIDGKPVRTAITGIHSSDGASMKLWTDRENDRSALSETSPKKS